MLVEFSVGNYRSFYQPVTLSMQAAGLRAQDAQVDADNVFECHDLHLLRSAAIYGANASGKSNLIHAMKFMRQWVLKSSKESQSGETIAIERFRLHTDAREKPAYFQIIFELEGVRYRYGFEADERQVHAEWLYRTHKRESSLFIREGKQYDLSGAFREGRGLETRTRDNALFLSVVAQFNGPVATAILHWFRTQFTIISGLEDTAYRDYTLERFQEDEAFRQRILAFVREVDLGIADIQVESSPFAEAPLPAEVRDAMESLSSKLQHTLPRRSDEERSWWVRQIKTLHEVFDRESVPVGWEKFDLEGQESQGTQKIFFLAGPLLNTLEEGKVLIIDELEARLHPFITRTVIRLFNSPQTNPHNAQLIFATHDTGLLSSRFFRRDQIWFTEKNKYGATDLYSLAELQVRNDASFDKDYIAGKYGAVPFIGGLSDLFGESADAADA